jgi:hypothetical protein
MMPALNAEIIEQNSTKGLEIQIVIGDKDPFLKDVKEFLPKNLGIRSECAISRDSRCGTLSSRKFRVLFE